MADKGSKPSSKPDSKIEDNVVVADISVASRTLADAADYSKGYPDTMPLHINRGRSK